MKSEADLKGMALPTPPITKTLPISGPAFERPDATLIERLQGVSSATASAMLHKMGVRQTFVEGPLPRTPGAKVVGPAVTLQFMPQREDIASGMAQEHVEKVSALWSVFETVQLWFGIPGKGGVVHVTCCAYAGVASARATPEIAQNQRPRSVRCPCRSNPMSRSPTAKR